MGCKKGSFQFNIKLQQKYLPVLIVIAMALTGASKRSTKSLIVGS